MNCHIQPIYALFIGMATAMNIFNVIITIRSMYNTCHLRAKCMMVVSVLMCLQSYLYFQWFVIQVPKQVRTVMLALAITHLALFFGSVASWMRYSVSFDAENRMKYQLYVVSVLMVILMYVISINFDDATRASDVQDVKYSKWTGMILIIPVGHVLLGLKMYINRIFRFSNTTSLGYALSLVQVVVTIVIIVLWVTWAVAFAVTNPPTPVTFILYSTVYCMEASVGLVSKQVQTGTEIRSSRIYRRTGTR
jgi:hypothetical protein